MLSVGIVGATGYTGIECVKLCLAHPKFDIKRLYAYSSVGKNVSDFFSETSHLPQLFETFDADSDFSDLDVLFLAVPHATSHQFMHKLVNKSLKIVDLSADFRLNSADMFNQFYNISHDNPELCAKIPYGLPEIYFSDIRNADIVANPGCYSTSVILGLYPLNQLDLTITNVIVDSKSGVSGAGKVLKPNLLYCEVNESVSAYSTAKHRHQAEFIEQLSFPVLFSPHLVPMSRGILSSMYISFDKPINETDIFDAFNSFYNQSPFVTVSLGNSVSTKVAIGTNMCFLNLMVLKESNQLVVFSVLDNLLKGAAGQAIQNMNIMCGFDQDLGLPKSSYLV